MLGGTLMKQSKGKRKFKLQNIVWIGFFLCFFFGFFLYLYHLPLQNIIITGTTYLSDLEVIEVAEIKDYPPLFQLNTKEIKSALLNMDFVKDVRIKRNILGRMTIEIVEERPVFYNRNRETLTFLSGKEMKTNELFGLPILVNYVPDEIYARMLREIQEMDFEVLGLISEIEYQPWKTDDVIIDDTRFYLRMNDGNVVYVNLINWEKLNNYMTIYSTLKDAKGTLQLDSSLGNGITFTPF